MSRGRLGLGESEVGKSLFGRNNCISWLRLSSTFVGVFSQLGSRSTFFSTLLSFVVVDAIEVVELTSRVESASEHICCAP